jgi:hypothetical protein
MGSWTLAMACASGARSRPRDSTRNGRGSPGNIPGEPLFLCRLVASGSLFWENNAHDPSGFDVPEHFREPEFMSLDNHDHLF